MSDENDDFERSLRRGVEQMTARLAELDAIREPVIAELHQRENALRSYLGRPAGSATITDDEIVVWLRQNASSTNPKLAPEIAAGMDIDARGIAKRLPRMVRENKIAGDHRDGYFAENHLDHR